MNLLQDLTAESLAERGLLWEHAPQKWEPRTGGGISVYVPAQVDYFQDPTGTYTKDNAPYLYANTTGNFVAKMHLSPKFTTTYDAGALMVRCDALRWAKICFESTDLGTTAAVSVVTREISDDANGADLSVPDLWLQICRVGEIYGMHYSQDGKTWRMVRFFHLALPEEVKVGLVAQSPTGPGTMVDFLYLSIEPRTVSNLRAGV